MIKDGVQIDKLVIFKTGSIDRVLRKAKQDGIRGEAFWGVVRGDGTDIRFELSRTDGFVTPPGTDLRLKEFLREAGLKFEPSYVIVDTLSSVEDADGENAAQAAGHGEPMTEHEPGLEENASEKFSRLLSSLLPHVDRALQTSTSVSEELNTSTRAAEELGRQGDFEQGLLALRQVGELLKRSLAEADAEMASSEPGDLTPTAQARPGVRRLWDARLTEVEPRYREAIRRAAPQMEQLQKIMEYAQDQARNQQFVKALAGINRLERLLDAVAK